MKCWWSPSILSFLNAFLSSRVIIERCFPFCRLTPPLAALYFVHLTIARRFTSGPFYENLFEMDNSKCRKNWWAFFLYIQNYAVPAEMVT